MVLWRVLDAFLMRFGLQSICYAIGASLHLTSQGKSSGSKPQTTVNCGNGSWCVVISWMKCGVDDFKFGDVWFVVVMWCFLMWSNSAGLFVMLSRSVVKCPRSYFWNLSSRNLQLSMPPKILWKLDFSVISVRNLNLLVYTINFSRKLSLLFFWRVGSSLLKLDLCWDRSSFPYSIEFLTWLYLRRLCVSRLQTSYFSRPI